MVWFTRYSRPARKGLPPGGRNHIKASSARTLCGIRLEGWIRFQALIVDVASRRRAYPDCASCRHLYAKRLEVAAKPAFTPAVRLAA
jgi:hypothetical protein